MIEGTQGKLLSNLNDVEIVRILLADLHDDLDAKVARFHQLADLSMVLGKAGTLLPGGEVAFSAWVEARVSFVHGNYVATVMLCQGLAEHVLAAELAFGLKSEELPKKISFQETLRRSQTRGVLSQVDVDDLYRLMELRNPLSHFRAIDDPSQLSRRVLDSKLSAQENLLSDATFAISVAVRLLALPKFRLEN